MCLYKFLDNSGALVHRGIEIFQLLPTDNLSLQHKFIVIFFSMWLVSNKKYIEYRQTFTPFHNRLAEMCLDPFFFH